MLPLDAVCIEVSVARVEVTDWIARGWIEPGGEPPDWQFAPGDIARVRLVRELRQQAGIEADSLALVLSLLDQVHAMRRALQTVLEGLEAQPEPVRRAVLARIARPAS